MEDRVGCRGAGRGEFGGSAPVSHQRERVLSEGHASINERALYAAGHQGFNRHSIRPGPARRLVVAWSVGGQRVSSGSWAAKKEGVPSDTPSALRAGRSRPRLFQCVNAGAEVDVKHCSIHHQCRDRFDSGRFRFFYPRLARAETVYFAGSRALATLCSAATHTGQPAW